ncbi:30S ribosomal protein S13 [bacterium]|jgi:small subunit ribosomal protein S13|nr:30S ribosomal protein S13 [bacterium]MBT4648832.1 30S ribosomal protein S13 [bacterium]
MARISGVNIPNDKRAEIALTYIYGVGLTTSQKILNLLKIDKNTRVKDISEEDINRLRQIIEKDLTVEGELRRTKISNIKRLKEVKSYRGSRHAKGLPARGQRTKTNSRTVRGNKRLTMGSGKTNAAQKT